MQRPHHPGMPAPGPETVNPATAPTDEPAGGNRMWKRVTVGPWFMVGYLEVQKRSQECWTRSAGSQA